MHSPLALQWRNLQIYVARPQLNRLTSFEIQGARTMMLSKVAYSAGVGGARFRRQFLDLWISFIGLPSLYRVTYILSIINPKIMEELSLIG